jgi:hypothetical protein
MPFNLNVEFPAVTCIVVPAARRWAAVRLETTSEKPQDPPQLAEIPGRRERRLDNPADSLNAGLDQKINELVRDCARHY